jgi:Ca2+-binding RTX toxin-like protein
MPAFGTRLPWDRANVYNSFDSAMGSRLTMIGDFNGDGINDFAVAEPRDVRTVQYTNTRYTGYTSYGAGTGTYFTYSSFNRYYSGVAAVVFGDADGLPPEVDLGALTPAQGFLIRGEQSLGFFGQSIAAAGDVNGDGLADLIVGTESIREAPSGSYRSGAGRSYVIFGSAAPLLNADGEMDADLLGFTGNGIVISGGERSGTGWEVFEVGDFNGDGIDDIGIAQRYGDDIVSTYTLPTYFGGTNTYTRTGQGSGRIVILPGSDTGLPGSIDLDALPAGAIVLDNPGQIPNPFGYTQIFNNPTQFGVSVDGGGDFNGDGASDVIVGARRLNVEAPSGSYNRYTVGAAYVFFGDAAAPGTSTSTTALDGTNGFAFLGTDSGDSTGTSVASLGDINGDGFDDYLIGAPGADTSYLYTNTFTNTYFNGYFTYTITTTNTYTRNYSSTGQAYVVLGQGGPMPATLTKDDLNSALGFQIGSNGTSSASQLGRVVAGVGDVNGDGFADMMVVDNIYVSGTTFVRASLIFGSATPQTETVLVNELDGTDGYRFFFDAGNSPRRLGAIDGVDLNGDGFSDIQFSRSGNTYYSASSNVFTPAQVFFGGSNTRFAYLDAYDGVQDGRIDTTLFGTNLFIGDIFAETETGTTGNDTIIGLAGNDTMTGGGGNDLIRGGTGNDTYRFVFATDNRDTFIETSGTDTIEVLDNAVQDLEFRRSGTDLIIEQAGTTARILVSDHFGASGSRIEFLSTLGGFHALKINNVGTGSSEIFADTSSSSLINALGGNDVVFAGGGNDTLAGGTGNDLLNGGTGNDTYRFAFATDGQDRLIETSGADIIEVTDSTAEALMFRRSGTDMIIERAGTSAQIIAADQFGASTSRIETLSTTSGSFTLKTDLTGTGLNEIFVGTSSGQAISAGGGNDIVWAAGGNDTLAGGTGNDLLNGGTGNDTYRFAFATDGQDRLIETSGSDIIEVTDSTAEALMFRSSGTDMIIERAGTSAQIIAVDQFGAATSRIETLSTTSGSFTLKTDLTGTGLNEIFVGTSSGQVISAGGGNDIVWAAGGNDTINGGAGNDRIYADTGNDVITGGAGDDRIEGGTGNDRYVFSYATDGRDVISEINGGGTDTLEILDREIAELGIRRSGTLLVLEDPDGPNRVVIEDHFSGIATNRIEIIEADDGLRFFKTGLIGTATSDIIVGASGNETITGGGGDDIIVGGGAKDALYGGAGADVFVFSQVSDSTAAAAGRDTIFDFSKAEGDRIAVTAIDANTGLAGDNDFVFIGLGATAGAGTLAYSFAGANTLVQADVDGGGADFSILLAGNIAFTAGDFIL